MLQLHASVRRIVRHEEAPFARRAQRLQRSCSTVDRTLRCIQHAITVEDEVVGASQQLRYVCVGSVGRRMGAPSWLRSGGAAEAC